MSNSKRLLADFLSLSMAIGGPYMDDFITGINLRRGTGKIRFADCPVCRAKRKTLYWYDRKYVCLKCREAQG